MVTAPPKIAFTIPRGIADGLRAEEDGLRDEVVRSLGWLLDIAIREYADGDLVVTIEEE